MPIKQLGDNHCLSFVITNNQTYQDVGIEGAGDAQGFMSSMATCLFAVQVTIGDDGFPTICANS